MMSNEPFYQGSSVTTILKSRLDAQIALTMKCLNTIFGFHS